MIFTPSAGELTRGHVDNGVTEAGQKNVKDGQSSADISAAQIGAHFLGDEILKSQNRIHRIAQRDQIGAQHFGWDPSKIGNIADRFEPGEDVVARQRKKNAGVQKIGPAKHVENGVVAAVILGRIRLHPLPNRPDLLLLFSLPGIVHGLSVFLPGGIVRERLERAGHRHAGEKMRGLVQSRAADSAARVLGNGRIASEPDLRKRRWSRAAPLKCGHFISG